MLWCNTHGSTSFPRFVWHFTERWWFSRHTACHSWRASCKFLHMLARNQMTRTMSFFCRSDETISRHFHNVLRSIIMLEDQFLRQPDGTQVPLEILQSSRFNPYFKVNISCIQFIFDSSLVQIYFKVNVLKDNVNLRIVLGHLMEHMFVSKCLMRMHQDIGVGRVTQHKMCWRHAHLI